MAEMKTGPIEISEDEFKDGYVSESVYARKLAEHLDELQKYMDAIESSTALNVKLLAENKRLREALEKIVEGETLHGFTGTMGIAAKALGRKE